MHGLLLHALMLPGLGGAPGSGPARYNALPTGRSVAPTLTLRWQGASAQAALARFADHAGPSDSTLGISTVTADSAVIDASSLALPAALGAVLPRLHAYYFSATELDRRPYLLTDVNPPYPQRATSQEAVVVQLRLLISASGRVDHAIVETLAVPMAFAEAAIDAFSDARFAPGLREQQAVPSQMRLELRYTP